MLIPLSAITIRVNFRESNKENKLKIEPKITYKKDKSNSFTWSDKENSNIVIIDNWIAS